MQWIVEYIDEGDYILIKLLSSVTFEEVRQICIEATSLAREHDSYKCLVDHRGVDIGLSVMEIHKVPGILREVGIVGDIRTAILLDSSKLKSNVFTFLKNVLSLASIYFELFSDKDKAIAWLKSVGRPTSLEDELVNE